jgi:galactose mutarotase-like enzyme
MGIAIYPTDSDIPPSLRDPEQPQFQIERVRLTEGKQAGCELIVVNSPGLSAAICPTRGMSLWKARLDGVDCQWGSPVRGPIHPSWVPLSESSGLGWLDGFDELLVRCGLRSFGAPDFDSSGQLRHPLHGHIGNLAAENVQIEQSADGQRLTISGEVFETRFLIHHLKLRVEYEFQLGQSSIKVLDRVSNEGGSAVDMQLLYHINFGRPLLAADCQFHTAARQIVARDRRAEEGLDSWNRYLRPTVGYAEQVYFFQPLRDSAGWVTTLLDNPQAGQAVAVHYCAATLPYFTLWKNTTSEATGYVTGLEPGTGFPNPRSFEQQHGRLTSLQPGEFREFELKLEGSKNSQLIAELKQRIQALQGEKSAELSGFRPDWCTPR